MCKEQKEINKHNVCKDCYSTDSKIKLLLAIKDMRSNGIECPIRVSDNFKIVLISYSDVIEANKLIELVDTANNKKNNGEVFSWYSFITYELNKRVNRLISSSKLMKEFGI